MIDGLCLDLEVETGGRLEVGTSVWWNTAGGGVCQYYGAKMIAFRGEM